MAFGVPAQEVDAVIVNVQVERKREYVPIVKLYLDKQDPTRSGESAGADRGARDACAGLRRCAT